MKTLLIIWHSRSGGSQQLAHTAAEGACTGGELELLNIRLLTAAQAQPVDVLTADGLLFAAPENLGTLSGAMKEFFDRSYYELLDRCVGKPYAALICAGNDGCGALAQLQRIATGWRLKAVAEPLIVRTGAQTPQAIAAPKHLDPISLSRAHDIGATLAAGLSLGLW